MIAKADKGGALCVITKQAMRDFELGKLSNCDQFECLGENDPTDQAHADLLEIWRAGKDQDFISREICHDVVGLCEKINGNKQRPSTASIFKPGTPYFYGLLKIHKLDRESLHPGTEVPLRLINNLSHSVTSRSDKYINWKYLQPLQAIGCLKYIIITIF